LLRGGGEKKGQRAEPRGGGGGGRGEPGLRRLLDGRQTQKGMGQSRGQQQNRGGCRAGEEETLKKASTAMNGGRRKGQAYLSASGIEPGKVPSEERERNVGICNVETEKAPPKEVGQRTDTRSREEASSGMSAKLSGAKGGKERRASFLVRFLCAKDSKMRSLTLREGMRGDLEEGASSGFSTSLGKGGRKGGQRIINDSGFIGPRSCGESVQDCG